MRRKCAECPGWTRMVCEFAFGEFWNEKSSGGQGCNRPLDDVAEAWKRDGWTLEKAQLATDSLGLTLGFRRPPMPPPLPQRPAKLASLMEKYRKGIGK